MSPLNLFFHGYFWVVIFFILSGFVLPLRFFKKQQPSSIYGGTYRRYLRLMIPLAVAASLYYLVAKTGLASELSLLNKIKRKNPGIFLVDVLMGCWVGDTSYFIAQWTLGIELFASFFIYLIAFTVVHYRMRLFFVYIPVATFLGIIQMTNDFLLTEYKITKGMTHFPMFLVGVWLADSECYPKG